MSASEQIPFKIKIDSSEWDAFERRLRSVGANDSSIGGLERQLSGIGTGARSASGHLGAMSGQFGGMSRAAEDAMRKISGLGGELGSIAMSGAKLGVAAAAGGLIALGTAAVSSAAKFESYRSTLATVLHSSEQAGIAFDRLQAFAAKTPFSLDQAVTGFIKLKALGLKPTEEALMSYGNTASAIGKDLNQMVEAVADAAMGEFERLKEFGISAKTTGDKVAFTFDNVTTTVKKNSKDIQAYLEGIGKTKFGDAMARQAMTFNGIMSNLKDNVEQTFAKIGEGGLNKAVAGIMSSLSSGLEAITPILVGLGSAMGGIVSAFGSILNGAGAMFGAINSSGTGSVSIIEALSFALNAVGFVASTLGSIIGSVMGGAAKAISAVADLIGTALGSALDWTGMKFEAGSRSWTNSLFGIINATKVVVGQMSNLFAIVISDVSKMFRMLGQQIGRVLSGDLSALNEDLTGKLKSNFASTRQAVTAIGRMGATTYRDTKAADTTMNTWFGREDKSLKDLNLDDPKRKKDAAKEDKDAAKKAAERAKREKEFWQSLQDQTLAAGMLANQAEVYNKQLDLRKILERDLNDAEKGRVSRAIAELNTAKALTELKQRTFEAQNEYSVELGRAKGLTDAQRSVEDEIFKLRTQALNKLVDINSTAYKQLEADLKLQLEKNAALKAQNDLLKGATDFAKKYSGAFANMSELVDFDKARAGFIEAFNSGNLKDALGNPMTTTVRDSILAGVDQARVELAQKPLLEALGVASGSSLTAKSALDRMTANNDLNRAKVAIAASGMSQEDQRRANREVTKDWQDRMIKANRLVGDHFVDTLTDGINDIASLFGGKFGELLGDIADTIQAVKADANGTSGTSRLMSMISGKLGEGFRNGNASMLDLGKGLKSIGSPLKGLKEAFSGPNGSAVKGIGTALGGAMAGYQMGGQIGGVMEMLGAKRAGKGAQIGGAFGGLTGNPLIAAAGSVVGGIIGQIFSKPKEAAAMLAVENGRAIAGAVKGYGKAEKAEALALAGSVADGLNGIAAKLGGQIGSIGVSVGYRPGHKAGAYRVDDTGAGRLTSVTAFESQADAIAYAIKIAVQKGAVTGLEDIIAKALKGMDTDAAISFAQTWKEFSADFAAMKDPIGAAARAIIDPLDSLRKTMVSIGASSTDLAKVEEYRTLKLKAALAEQLSSLNGFLDALKGEGSGVTKLDRLTTDRAKFADMAAKIAAGDSSIDQSSFTSLGQSIFSLAGEIYGTATQSFQDIRSQLIGVTEGFANNVTSSFNAATNDATVTALNAQTQAIVANQVIQNDYLAQIKTGIDAVNENIKASGGGAVASNGSYTKALR